ncbi:MAG TPA: FABP family protein [Anaerolineales bacterium]|nr:FABP family protein [Anaerolineales bacterium]
MLYNQMMSNPFTNGIQLFDLLQGTWAGDGRGGFPTVTSFDYRETLTFTRRDEKTLAYEQRAQKRYDGQTDWLESHWENGFIRILESDELEWVSAQIGRSEVLIGSIESVGAMFRIHFVSKSIMNDPRMISSARTFELEGDSLHYEMEMQTTKVNQSTQHLKIALQREK